MIVPIAYLRRPFLCFGSKTHGLALLRLLFELLYASLELVILFTHDAQLVDFRLQLSN